MLEFIGASIRYFWSLIWNLLKGKRIISFKDFIGNRKDRVEDMDKSAGDEIIGAFFLVLLLIIIYFFN